MAILCSSGHPISIATNDLNKTHPLTYKHSPFKKLHAEIKCLRNAPQEKIEGSTLYVWRLRNDNGQWGMAKPCPICQEEIRQVGIKKVYYSTNEGNFEFMRLG